MLLSNALIDDTNKPIIENVTYLEQELQSRSVIIQFNQHLHSKPSTEFEVTIVSIIRLIS